MSNHPRQPQDSADRSRRASNQTSSPASTGNHPQPGSTIEQQRRPSRHPTSQSSNSRSQQGYEPKVRDLAATSQNHNRPFNPGQSTSNSSTTSYQLAQASLGTDSRSRQIYGADPKGSTTQIDQQPPIAEPPTRSFSKTSNQSAPRIADNHSQQSYDANYTKSGSQSTHGPPISATLGNVSSMTSYQLPQASRVTESGSQQPGPAGSTARTHRQLPVSEPAVCNPSLKLNQSVTPARSAGSDPRQVHDLDAFRMPFESSVPHETITNTATRSRSQSHSHPSGSGQSVNNSPMTSYQLSQASPCTDSRLQPAYDSRSTPQAHYQSPVSELPIRGSSMAFNQSASSRRVESHQLQIYDANYEGSSGQSTYSPPVSVSHGNTSSMASYHSPQTHGPTDSHSQQGYDTGPGSSVAHIPHHSSEPPANNPSELPGRELTGDIEILLCPGTTFQWRIGTGAFTDVYKGKCLKAGIINATPAFVAVKLFRASTEEKREVTDATNRRVIRESNVWLRLSHPNILPYLGHCSDLGLAIALISPLCDYGNVIKYITEHPSAVRKHLVKDVAEGLKYLHSEDVIHADLHPKNILVDNIGRARLADFGRAKIIGEKGYSTSLLAGCASYMAPELFPTSEPEVDVDALFSKDSDVYAFAMVCFEILTDEAPFASYGVRRVWQIINLIQGGNRPQPTPRIQDLIPHEVWEIMQDCWTSSSEERISAEDIVWRMHLL